ncbi:MAG: ArnT family glycosyltransferase [Ktedonobacteraceae bacterium]
MRSTLSGQQETNTENIAHNHISAIRSCLLAWEIYPIILVAGFLRLYRLDTAAFSGDQSTLFILAYNAVHHGLIPATSNGASILTMHPPATIYFLMLPALFSSDPLWAVIMTAMFNVIAVLITYIFTRRYYGRLTASIAAFLYATAGTTIVFSRFIWQPNLLAPFVILYLFALFWGVVERRKGWLFPALLLLGVMYQLHELTLLLVVPLLVAIPLAPGTIRLRDVSLAFVCLLLIFAPYLVWEVSSGFTDLHTLSSLAKTHALFDTQALTFYERLLRSYYYDERFIVSSYYDPVGSAFSAVFKLLLVLNWAYRILVLLLLGSLVTVGIIIVRNQTSVSVTQAQGTPVKKPFRGSLFLARLHTWWSNLGNDPARCGLVVLLAWQIMPPLILVRHTAPLHQHYLLMTIPGPFILIGFFITHTLRWFRQQGHAYLWQGMRYATYAVTTLILITQLMGSTAALVDTVNGVNSHVFGYNDLGSLQHALHEADQIAQQRHFNRIYITISSSDDSLTGLPFLAEQMHTPTTPTTLATPTTLFDAAHCLVLPAPEAGPALLLVRSTDSLVLSLLNHFANATLIDQPPLLGTSPFQLYIVTPIKYAQPAPARDSFVNHLLLLTPHPQQLSIGTSSYLVTSWSLLRNEQSLLRTSYTYMMTALKATPGTTSIRSDCMLTSIRAGDQLLTAFRLPQGSTMSPSLKITSQFLVSSPYNIALGPMYFETVDTRGIPATLQTMDRSSAITIYPTAMPKKSRH